MRARVSLAWLWLLVAVQVAIPASYYLVRDDRDDERFAWRMFSAVRLKRCEVEAFDGDPSRGGANITLSAALHASWVRSLGRGRRSVIERFLATRCGSSAAAGGPVLIRTCTWPSGKSVPEERYAYDCANSRLTVRR